MLGLDYAEKKYPFIDKNRECALGASYGGYMIDWILGHTDRFKCLVSHDGMFDTDLGVRHHRRTVVPRVGVPGHAVDEPRDVRAMVSEQLRDQVQDANPGRAQPARLPARRLAGTATLHLPAAAEGSVEDALLPRRRATGC